MRYVKDVFTVHFQNLFRNLASLLFLWPAVFLLLGRRRVRDVLRGLPRALPKIGLIGLFTFLFQLAFTTSLYLIYPAVMTLIYQSNVLFSVLFAVVFFADERKSVGRRVFQVGLVMAAAGVLVVIGAGAELGRARFGIGVLTVTLAAVCWAMVGTLVRKWLPAVPGIVSVSAVFTCVFPLYVATYLVASGGFPIPRAPAGLWAAMLLSGVVGMGVGQTAYYYAVGTLGIALAGSLGLLIPLLVGVLSFIVFGEVLSLWQILGGVVLLSGSYLVIRSRFGSLEGG